jgi:hypothetical protein
VAGVRWIGWDGADEGLMTIGPPGGGGGAYGC